jgi:DNA-directed RNA polymerase subunit RPC12/RpoP
VRGAHHRLSRVVELDLTTQHREVIRCAEPLRQNCIFLFWNSEQTVIAMAIMRYRCPDCGQEVESSTMQQATAGCDTYESVLCPKCQQVHSVNPADGEVAGEDELGDPW